MAANRLLPAGKICTDCSHWNAFCKHVISSLKGDETWCDWSPSRFFPLHLVPADPKDDEPDPTL